MATSFPSYRKNVPAEVTEQIQKCYESLPRTGLTDFDSVMCGIIASHGTDIVTEIVSFAIGSAETFEEEQLEEKREELKQCILALVKKYGLGYVAKQDRSFFLYDAFGLTGKIRITEGTVTSSVVITMPMSLIEDFVKDIKEEFVEQELHIVREITHNQRVVFHQARGLLIKNYSELDVFFPFVKQGIGKWWGDFSKSSSDVTLLVGPPGTGKSSFIKSCIDARGKAEKDVYIASSEDTMKHDDFMSYVKKLREGSLLILEDADGILGKRTEGNNTMAELLNTISGVLSTKIKIIITTNRPNIGGIDEALLRPGRTYDIIEFRHLTSTEANAARQAIEKEPLGFEGKDKLTLAQALNWGDGNASRVVANRGPGF